jgi:hypothetical protein
MKAQRDRLSPAAIAPVRLKLDELDAAIQGALRPYQHQGGGIAVRGQPMAPAMAIDKAAGKHRRPCETVRIRWL